MSNESYEDKLRSLSPNESTVLSLKCQDLKYEVIAERLGYSIDWVQLQMSNVYKKLDFKKEMHWTQRKKILDEQVCPRLKDIREGVSEEVQPEPEPSIDPQMLALVLYDEDKRYEIVKVIPEQPIPPPPPRPRRGRLWVLALIVFLGCLGLLRFVWGRVASLPFVATATYTATASSTQIPSTTFTNTPAATFSPTSSPMPTDTPTLTPTFTPVPTDTKSPFGLMRGDVLTDGRVALKLEELKYEQGRTTIGNKPLAPIVFGFTFTNHSGETILLQFGPENFRVEDNLGNKLTCDFWNGIVETTDTIQGPLGNEGKYGLGAFCGEGRIPAGVTTYTLFVTNFSSLPDSTWIAEINR